MNKNISLGELWEQGYSIPELWGKSSPIQRPPSGISEPPLILWGILSIVEYQVDHGAGSKYLHERLLSREWIALGKQNFANDKEICVVPVTQNSKVYRNKSFISNGHADYADVRIVHSAMYF